MTKLKLPESIAEIHDIAFNYELSEAIERDAGTETSLFIPLREFASIAGVAENTVQHWVSSGKLKYETRDSGQRIVNVNALLRMPEIQLDGDWSHQGGTIKTQTKAFLNDFALAGNKSFTIDIGVRLALALFGLIGLKHVLPGIARIANRHPRIRDEFAKNARLLYLFAHEEHNLNPEPFKDFPEMPS